jgi:hypothetical protein
MDEIGGFSGGITPDMVTSRKRLHYAVEIRQSRKTGGNFTGWDSYIYEETPPGVWYPPLDGCGHVVGPA